MTGYYSEPEDAVGGLTGGEKEGEEQGGGGPLDEVTDQAQEAASGATDQAGQATDQAQQVAGQAQDAAGGLTGGGQDDDTSGESDDNSESYSYSDSDSTTTTMEEGNEGLLGGLLGLNLLPSPESSTKTVESGGSESSFDSGEDSESEGERADSDEG